MRIECLKHVPFEDAANIGVWAGRNGHELHEVELYDGVALPGLDQFDLLTVMGGPMNIYEEDKFPWLKAEKLFLKSAVDAGKRILGVCLGAQLLADVLGGPVTRNPEKEIGWFDVTLMEAAGGSLLGDLPERFMAFHWHGDTFAVPPGAVHLAESRACRNQAFQYGQRVLGLQFHLDYSTESIEKMIAHASDELIEAPYVNRPEDMRSGYAYLPGVERLLYGVLDRLAAS